MKKIKGGVESIIAVIILAGIVIALIIAVIVPLATGIKNTGAEGKGRVDTLTEKMRPTSTP